MQSHGELTPAGLIGSAHLPHDERASDGTRVRPRMLRAVLLAIYKLSSRADYNAIAAAAEIGRNTVERGAQVLARLGLLLPPEETRDAMGRVSGKRYRINWTELGTLCRDDRLAIFARALADGDIEPRLHPVAESLHPVAGSPAPRGPLPSLRSRDESHLLPSQPSLHQSNNSTIASASQHPVAESQHPVAGNEGEIELTRLLAEKRAAIANQIPAPVGVSQVLQAKIDAALSPSAREGRMRELVGIQLRRVRDHRLMRAPCKDLAWAIIDGRVKERDMLDALDALDEKDARHQLNAPRSSYWNGCIKRLLGRRTRPREPHERPP